MRESWVHGRGDINMGTLRGDNGGERPPDGGGLPDLPPEWGQIIIPDNAAELEHEAAIVRRQMRRAARANRWRRRLGLPPLALKKTDDDSPALGLPLLIMSIAIIATLTSLFAIAWPSKSGTPSRAASGAPAATASSLTLVADVTLADPSGAPLHLRTVAPAVVLLVDGCGCADLLAQTSRAVDAAVTVLAVASTIPPVPSPAPGHLIRAARDAKDTLRATYAGSPPSGGVTAILVSGAGLVLGVVSPVNSVDQLSSYLPELD
jgi:hypothetical protein